MRDSTHAVMLLLHREQRGPVEIKLRGTPLEGPFAVDAEPLSLPWRRIQREPWLWGLTSDT